MSENPGNHRGLFKSGNDLQGAATVGAVFHVDIENPFEQPAQLMRAELACWGAPSRSSEVSFRVSARLGMICGRSLALGASTPWKRIRLSLGRGTKAARRCMNSSGGITMWVVAVLVRAFELQHDIAGAVELEPFIGDGGACYIAAQLFVATRSRFLELSPLRRNRRWDHPFRRVYLPA